MGVLEKVWAFNKSLAFTLKQRPGMRRLMEGLYPDRGHFIYELLQNAEDTGATEATFILRDDHLVFEHDGRPFTEQDLYAITDIGNDHKEWEPDQIGRFGVGFKSVFAYTETPSIWCPTFSFKLVDLVLPRGITPNPELGDHTRFRFPFDNPKKLMALAHQEVAAKLDSMAENTLLFLTRLGRVRWRIRGQSPCEIQRIAHSEHHFEVLKRVGERIVSQAHFLVFSRPVEGLVSKHVALAFELGLRPGVEAFDPGKSLARQLRIVPAKLGKVSIFFPAEKEASGLRFHLHAPFVPEASRASIKDTPVNGPLFDQLAELAAASLHRIRDLKLLTPEFLGVLPNPDDDLSSRYQPILNAILHEMNHERLTPVRVPPPREADARQERVGRRPARGRFAPARHLLQSKASLKALLSDYDLEYLVTYEEEPPRWAINGTAKNTDQDRFLEALDIGEYSVDAFLEALKEGLDENFHWSSRHETCMDGPDPEFQAWLAGKSTAWHGELYAFLYRELTADGKAFEFPNRRIVRLANGSYGYGNESYFPAEGAELGGDLPVVAGEILTAATGRSAQKETARAFLEAVGVTDYGETAQIKGILAERYQDDGFAPQAGDLRMFIDFLEANPGQEGIFRGHSIFELEEYWARPEDVFLDSPFLDTGLTAYQDALGTLRSREPLDPNFIAREIGLDRVTKFATLVGAQTQLEIIPASCTSNPDWGQLDNESGDRIRAGRDQDWTIYGLGKILENPSIKLSRLLWQTLSALPRNTEMLTAVYQKSKSRGPVIRPSQLVHHLKNAKWVPQAEGTFVTPGEACRDQLPPGFPYDSGQAWLAAVSFGAVVQSRSAAATARRNLGISLGFKDERQLERSLKFSNFPVEEQERFFSECEARINADLPNPHLPNPELRRKRVFEQAAQAPERVTKHRLRAVVVGGQDVKGEAEEYLRHQYTRPDGEMICQACAAPLPFKLADGSPYFEKVAFLPGLDRLHYQNHLALCPNHAAMFMLANNDEDQLPDLFLKMSGSVLVLTLAQQRIDIHFTRPHLADLQVVADVEGLSG